MFTVNKWQSLPLKTRLRKLSVLLHKAEVELSHEKTPDLSFFRTLLQSDTFEHDLAVGLRESVETTAELLTRDTDPASLRRGLNRLRHSLLRELDAEPAEWDLMDPDGIRLLRDDRRIQPTRIYLQDIRSPFNVGSIFRTAEAFGVDRIYLSPDTPLPTHRKAMRTARGCNEVIPWEVGQLDVIDGIDVFALETGGTPISEFPFPTGLGVALIGSEELGLSPEALKLADEKAGRVSIPLVGSKRSLNVAVAFGILMWHWHLRHLSQIGS
jgi:TrmH family RNA methyltransferase